MSANESSRRIEVAPSKSNTIINNELPYQAGELGENSIRLVEIHEADSGSEPVNCSLHEITFGSKPRFGALSHRWGTDKAEDVITLEGFPFQVGRNLLDALRFLRHHVPSGKTRRLLWIDAICIHQKNVKERNRQLRIMDQKYLRADTVVVWLGSRYVEFQRKIDDQPKADAREEQGRH
ncbi:hypothetical protein NW757_014459 [Fusarium falciforme]|nr:hypothetical protein NW757_014459 [Fusarium falciforme]